MAGLFAFGQTRVPAAELSYYTQTPDETQETRQRSRRNLKTISRYERRRFPPERLRPGRHGWTERQRQGDRDAKARRETSFPFSGKAVRAGPLGAAADLPGDGRSGKRRRHQACDVRDQSSGMQRYSIQSALAGGTRSRISVESP